MTPEEHVIKAEALLIASDHAADPLQASALAVRAQAHFQAAVAISATVNIAAMADAVRADQARAARVEAAQRAYVESGQ